MQPFHHVSSDEKIIASFSYIFILFLVPLLGKKHSNFAQFHAKQGVLLFSAWFAVFFLGMVPIIGWLIVVPLGTFLLLLLSVIGFINALSGQEKQLPIIGKYAKRLHIE